MEAKEYWDKRVEQINDLRKLLDEKPEEYKIGWSVSYGGILNAYREGDLSFEEAKQKLAEVKANPLEPLVRQGEASEPVLLADKVEIYSAETTGDLQQWLNTQIPCRLIKLKCDANDNTQTGQLFTAIISKQSA